MFINSFHADYLPTGVGIEYIIIGCGTKIGIGTGTMTRCSNQSSVWHSASAIVGTQLMALFKVIDLHIVDLFPNCFGSGGIVTTCVLCSTRTGDDPRETDSLFEIFQLDGPPVSDDNDETFTLAGRSDRRSS